MFHNWSEIGNMNVGRSLIPKISTLYFIFKNKLVLDRLSAQIYSISWNFKMRAIHIYILKRKSYFCFPASWSMFVCKVNTNIWKRFFTWNKILLYLNNLTSVIWKEDLKSKKFIFDIWFVAFVYFRKIYISRFNLKCGWMIIIDYIYWNILFALNQ